MLNHPGSSIFSLCKRLHKISSSKYLGIFLTVFLCFLQHLIGYLLLLKTIILFILRDVMFLTNVHHFLTAPHVLSLTFPSITWRLETLANELRPRFAPTSSTFSAIKHDVTRNLLLASSPRVLCIILYMAFLVLAFDWHPYVLQNLIVSSRKIPEKYEFALTILSVLIPVIRVYLI